MRENMSLGRALALAISILPLTSAVACPYIEANEPRGAQHSARSTHESRASADGPGFGRCSRMSKVAGGGTRSYDWWPCELRLDVLRQNSERVNPFTADFDYATVFAGVDGR